MYNFNQNQEEKEEIPSVSEKEHVNWKDRFERVSDNVTNKILEHNSRLPSIFKIWYNIIPQPLVDFKLKNDFETFDFKTSANREDKWLELYNQVWNWAYRRRVIIVLAQSDDLAMEWDEFGRMTKERDENGIRQWTVARID